MGLINLRMGHVSISWVNSFYMLIRVFCTGKLWKRSYRFWTGVNHIFLFSVFYDSWTSWGLADPARDGPS